MPKIPFEMFTLAEADDRAVRGVHNHLIFYKVPAAASQALLGTKVKDATITVDGDYVCLIPIGGLATELKVHVKPQLDSMTLSSSGPDEIALVDPYATDATTVAVLTAGSGDGALADDTLQTATLAVTGGRYAIYTLTAGASPTNITFDVAEYTGR